MACLRPRHADTGVVLMLGYTNQEALETSLARGRVVLFSRSKERLWEKGETPGHTLKVVSVRADRGECHLDSFLADLLCDAVEPACHQTRPCSCHAVGVTCVQR